MRIRTSTESFVMRVVVAATLIVPACSSPTYDACPTGTAGCLCNTTSSSCQVGLRCDAGYCVPTDCIPGVAHCTCSDGQNCELGANQQPLSCRGGICTSVEGPKDGAFGGVCRAAPAEPCDARGPDGRELTCVRGLCQMTDCPSESLGCGCGIYGQCDAQGDQIVYCSRDGLCALGAGTPGVIATQVALRVGNDAVRACDMVLEATTSSAGFGSITLSPAVVAHYTLKSPYDLAISFIARSAAPLDVVASFASAGEALHVSVAHANCYDTDGQAITEPSLSVSVGVN